MISRKTEPYERFIGWIDTMNSIYEDTKRRYLREGREEGLEIGDKKRIEDLANAVSSVMQKAGLSLEEAFEVTSIPESDRPLIIDRLSSS